MQNKKESYQQQLERELEIRGLDIEIDMWKCGNLEMVCKTVLESLKAGNQAAPGFPSCVRVFSVKK